MAGSRPTARVIYRALDLKVGLFRDAEGVETGADTDEAGSDRATALT